MPYAAGSPPLARAPAVARAPLAGPRDPIRRLRALVLAALVAAVAAFAGTTLALVGRLAQSFGPEVRADLEWRARRGAHDLAQGVAAGVAAGDAARARAGFGDYPDAADIAAIIAVGADGAVIAQHGRVEAIAPLLAAAPGTIVERPGQLASWSPIEHEGRAAGKLALVVSTDRLTEAEALLASVRGTTLVAAAVALVIGALAVLVATRALRSRDAQLREHAATLERSVAARTRELDERNRGLRHLLDHVAQGFLTIDLHGVLAPERSAVVDRWFGAHPPGATLGDLLRPHAPELAEWLALGLESLRDGALPVEVSLDQLPRRLAAGGRVLDIAYTPVGGDPERPERLLVIVSDATARVAAARAERDQRELLAVFERITADRAGCEEFMSEATELVRGLEQPRARELEDRALHTLKGNCALFGFERFAELCHALESELRETGAPGLDEAQRARLVDGWQQVVRTMVRLLGAQPRDVVEIERGELAALIARARAGAAGRELAAALAAWTHEPVARRLERLGQHAAALAQRLGKGELAVTIDDAGVRLDASRWAAFWAAAVHAVRNAVDHGLPPAGAAQRPPALALTAARADGQLVLTIADNGRGVDWDAVRARAAAAGLPATTRADLVAALFADGLSTRDEASATSGRGVGLGALRAAAAALGGVTEIASAPGAGTRLVFKFPAEPPPAGGRPVPPRRAADSKIGAGGSTTTSGSRP